MNDPKPHPSRRLLFTYFQNELPADEVLDLEEHLADCEQCVSEARQVHSFVDFWNRCTPPVPDLNGGQKPRPHGSLPLALFDQLKASYRSVKDKARRFRKFGQSEMVRELFSIPALIITTLFVSVIGSMVFPSLHSRQSAFSASLDERPAFFSGFDEQQTLLPASEMAFNSLFSRIAPPAVSFSPMNLGLDWCQPSTEPILITTRIANPSSLPLWNLMDDMQELHARMTEAERKLAAALEEEVNLSQGLNRLQCEQPLDPRNALSSPALFSVRLEKTRSIPLHHGSWPLSWKRKGAEMLVSR